MVHRLARRPLNLRRTWGNALLALFLAGWACAQAPDPLNPTPLPATPAIGLPAAETGRIAIGTEYILIDQARRMGTLAEMLGPLGITAAKPLGEHIEWGAMQSGPQAPIDFGRLDDFVLRPLGEFLVVGKSESVDVVEVMGFRSDPPPGSDELLAGFAAALRAFKAQNWEAALADFRKVAARFPEDGPTRFFRKLCKTYVAGGPPENNPTRPAMTAK